MKQIPLTKGYTALVDDEDYEQVNQFPWYALVTEHTVYAAHDPDLLHRFVLGLAPDGPMVDHHDSNGLNCQKVNLRVCTRTQNQGNRRKETTRPTSSKYKGVCWHKAKKKWVAQIDRTGGTKHLGSFVVEEDAARAYEAAARLYFGEFALTNFPLPLPGPAAPVN